MAPGEQPFDEREQRYFLAEILKVSSIAPLELLAIIKDKKIEPRWMDISLPNGRSLSACSRAFSALHSFSIGSPSQMRAPFIEQEAWRPKPWKSMPQIGRAIGPTTDPAQHQPEPNFLPINPRGEPISTQTAPIPPGPSFSRTEKQYSKKRGRPSKAEHEERVRAAAERGEVYPRPKKRRPPQESFEGVFGQGTSTPTTNNIVLTTESSIGKSPPELISTPKPAVTENPYAPNILKQSLAVDAGSNSADQTNIGRTPLLQSMFSKPQTLEKPSTDFSSRESGIASMQEVVRQSAASPMQSTSPNNDLVSPTSASILSETANAATAITDLTAAVQTDQGAMNSSPKDTPTRQS